MTAAENFQNLLDFGANSAELALIHAGFKYHGDYVPYNRRPRKNQQTVVDPEDLEDAHDSRHPRVHACARPTPKQRDQVR